MAFNSTHSFDIYPISPKSNQVAHPDSGRLGETLMHNNYCDSDNSVHMAQPVQGMETSKVHVQAIIA